jgi:NitT/TauT family transport system substrate-binding protein
MLNRRQLLTTSVAATSLATIMHGRSARSAPAVKIRYNEVVHSLFYAPAYVAIAKGMFSTAGIEVEMTTANGGDKSIAALLGGAADIALVGPEAPIYVLNSESPRKVRIFCGLTATDGYLLVSRDKPATFDWGMVKGATVMGWRPGSTPQLFLQAAMRHNRIDPLSDVTLINTIAPPARMGAWLAGQAQYAIFAEPDASQLELGGKGHIVASVGQQVGQIDYTAFMATDDYVRANPTVVQAWANAIAKAMTWTASASVADLAAVLLPFFPGVDNEAMVAGVERYRRLAIWKKTPVIDPAAIERFQDILVQSDVLEASKRVKYSDLVVAEFAQKVG